MTEIISLTMSDGGKLEVVAVAIFGDWAVHQGPRTVYPGRGNPRPAWQLTHVPTGLSAMNHAMCGITKADAMKCAKALSRAELPPDPMDPAHGVAASRVVYKVLGWPCFDTTAPATREEGE